MQETALVYVVYLAAVGVGLVYMQGVASGARNETMFRELEVLHGAAKRFAVAGYGYRGLSTEGLADGGLLARNMVLEDSVFVMTAEGRLPARVCGDQVCPPGGPVASAASGAVGFRTWVKPAGTEPRLSFGFSMWIGDVREVGVCTQLVAWRPKEWPERVGVQVQAGAGGSGVQAPAAIAEGAFPPAGGCGGVQAIGWSVLNPAVPNPVPWELEESGPRVRAITRTMASAVCECMVAVGPVSVGLGFRNL